MPALVCQLLYCTTVLFKGLSWKIKHVLLFVLDLYVSFAWKVLKPITIQYYIADWVHWVIGLTLLDLWTNWTYECTLRTELIHMQGTYSTLMITFSISQIRKLRHNAWIEHRVEELAMAEPGWMYTYGHCLVTKAHPCNGSASPLVTTVGTLGKTTLVSVL